MALASILQAFPCPRIVRFGTDHFSNCSEVLYEAAELTGFGAREEGQGSRAREEVQGGRCQQ